MQKNFCKLAVEVCVLISDRTSVLIMCVTCWQTYIMASLHKKIFKEVCFTVASKVREGGREGGREEGQREERERGWSVLLCRMQR